MTILSVEDIIAADDLCEAEIEMPEWGGSIKIRGLGYGEFVTIRESAQVGGQQDERIFGRLLLAAAFVDPVLDDDQADALFNKSSVAVDRITTEIVRLSAIGNEAFVESEATFPG